MAYIQTIERSCPNCQSSSREIYSSGYDFEYRTCENNFNFVKCKNCGLVYLNPAPAPERLGEIYPSDYKPFHFNIKKRDFILLVRNALEIRKASIYGKMLPQNARILDVGCGDGRYLSILGKVSSSWELVGIDFGAIAVQRAIGRGLKVVLGTYETTDMGKDRYDLIILNQVIEHFFDPASVVDKLYDEIKPYGYVSIETPSLDGWDAFIFKNVFWGGYHFPRHLVLFTEKTITCFLEKRAFKVVSVRYLPSPVFWVFSLHHLWNNYIGYGSRFWSDSNPIALGFATILDMCQSKARRKTSNMQVIARKEMK